MVKVPLLCIVVIIIATFAPSPVRGAVIVLCCGLALWYTAVNYGPYADTPDLPPRPNKELEEAESLISKYGVEKTKNQKIGK